jgi:hypothetical protein
LADCHRRTSEATCKSRSGFNSAGWRHRSAHLLPEENKRDLGGLSCEIVSDLCPNPLSHDWHVQPSCQRPNRLPPERRAFSPGEPAQVRIRLSSKPYNNIGRAKPCQSAHPTAFPRVFHMRKVFRMGGRGAQKARNSTQRYRLPLWTSKTPIFRRTPKRKTEKLRKDPFGGPCFEGTLRKLQLPESSPVAGTIENSHSLKT